MRFSKLGKIQSEKRGISSIVGGVFFLVLMVTGFTVYFLALDTQARMIDTQQTIADIGIKKIQEKFSVAAAFDPSDFNRLSLQVGNEGNNALEIADFWIVDKTDPAQPATQYEIDYVDAHIPVGFDGNILENTPLFMGAAVYDITVVSTLGTIVRAELDTVGLGNNLAAQLYAIPPDVSYGETATLALFVTNVADIEITGVVPLALDVNPPGALLLGPPCDEIEIAPVDLKPGESTFFTWHCKTIIGSFNSAVIFTGQATGSMGGVTVTSNPALDTAIIRDPTGGGIGDDLIVDETFLARPKIYMIVPSPFGNDPNDKALWGVNIVNPTPNTMEVRKVTITALTSRPQMQDKMFDEQFCTITTVAPTPPSWTCPVQNQLMWKDFTTPIIIPAFENYPFLVMVEPGKLAAAGDILETVLVDANVFTSFGQFGKSAYASSMANDASSLVNVFLTDTPDTFSPTNVIAYKSGILAGTTITLHAIMGDFDTGGTFQIADNSRLIINIPFDWTLSPLPASTANFDIITVQSSLGQNQIIAQLDGNLATGGKSLTFTIEAPCVPFTKFYVMHILADGEVLDGGASLMSLGPLAETVLQVDPDLINCPVI